MSVTKSWKIYGLDGHRQKQSFGKSIRYDFSSEKDGTRILEMERVDKTGTNDYVILRITRDTEAQCQEELNGQLSDGIFENTYVGRVVEI